MDGKSDSVPNLRAAPLTTHNSRLTAAGEARKNMNAAYFCMNAGKRGLKRVRSVI